MFDKWLVSAAFLAIAAITLAILLFAFYQSVSPFPVPPNRADAAQPPIALITGTVAIMGRLFKAGCADFGMDSEGQQWGATAEKLCLALQIGYNELTARQFMEAGGRLESAKWGQD